MPVSPTFELQLRKEGIIATARELDGEFTVLEGSKARSTWIGVQHAYKALHEKLVQEAALVPDNGCRTMRFAHDQVFASPSAAAAVVVGRTSNGRNSEPRILDYFRQLLQGEASPKRAAAWLNAARGR